ncbi:leucine-rich repeat protein [Metamycoplasma neophronis]|nr:leucine-rich repeat protein [Metamycoplasma neophronis]
MKINKKVLTLLGALSFASLSAITVACNNKDENSDLKLKTNAKIQNLNFVNEVDKKDFKEQVNKASSIETINELLKQAEVKNNHVKSFLDEDLKPLREIKLDKDLINGQVSNAVNEQKEVNSLEKIEPFKNKVLGILKSFYKERINLNLAITNKDKFLKDIENSKTLAELDGNVKKYVSELMQTLKAKYQTEQQNKILAIRKLEYLSNDAIENFIDVIQRPIDFNFENTRLYEKAINELNTKWENAQRQNLNNVSELIDSIINNKEFNKEQKEQISETLKANKVNKEELYKLLNKSREELLKSYQSFTEQLIEQIKNAELKEKMLSYYQNIKNNIENIFAFREIIDEALVVDANITFLKNNELKGISQNKDSLIALMLNFQNQSAINEFKNIIDNQYLDFSKEDITAAILNKNISRLRKQYIEKEKVLPNISALKNLISQDEKVQTLQEKISAKKTTIEYSTNQDEIINLTKELDNINKEALSILVYRQIPEKMLSFINEEDMAKIDKAIADANYKVMAYNLIEDNVFNLVKQNLIKKLLEEAKKLQTVEIKNYIESKTTQPLFTFEDLNALAKRVEFVSKYDDLLTKLKSDEYQYISNNEKQEIIKDFINENKEDITKEELVDKDTRNNVKRVKDLLNSYPYLSTQEIMGYIEKLNQENLNNIAINNIDNEVIENNLINAKEFVKDIINQIKNIEESQSIKYLNAIDFSNVKTETKDVLENKVKTYLLNDLYAKYKEKISTFENESVKNAYLEKLELNKLDFDLIKNFLDIYNTATNVNEVYTYINDLKLVSITSEDKEQLQKLLFKNEGWSIQDIDREAIALIKNKLVTEIKSFKYFNDDKKQEVILNINEKTNEPELLALFEELKEENNQNGYDKYLALINENSTAISSDAYKNIYIGELNKIKNSKSYNYDEFNKYISVLKAANKIMESINSKNPKFNSFDKETLKSFAQDIYDADIISQEENLEFKDVFAKYVTKVLELTKNKLIAAIDVLTIIPEEKRESLKQSLNQYSTTSFDEINLFFIEQASKIKDSAIEAYVSNVKKTYTFLLDEDINEIEKAARERFDTEKVSLNINKINKISESKNLERKRVSDNLKWRFIQDIESHEYLKLARPELISSYTEEINQKQTKTIDETKEYLENINLAIEKILPYKKGEEVVEIKGVEFTILNGVLNNIKRKNGAKMPSIINLPQVYKISPRQGGSLYFQDQSGYEISWNETITSISFENLYIIEKSELFNNLYSLKEANLGHITELSPYLFNKCKNLVNLTLANKITKVHDYALRRTKIENFDFSAVTEIGELAFEKTNIKQSLNSDSIKKIGRGAFANSKITEINLKNLTYLGKQAFYNTDIQKVILPNLVDIEENTRENVLIEKDNNYSHYYYDYTTYIGIFENNKKLTHVELNSINTISDLMFRGCLNLVDVSIPRAKTIGLRAFVNTAITNIKLPEVKTIKEQAFSNTGLLEANMPMVETIENMAFYNASKLSKLIAPKLKTAKNNFISGTQIEEINLPSLVNIELKTFWNISDKLKTFKLDSIESLADYDSSRTNIFDKSNMTNLTKIDLPNIKYIGKYKFNNLGIDLIKNDQIVVNIPKIEFLGSYALNTNGLLGKNAEFTNLKEMKERALPEDIEVLKLPSLLSSGKFVQTKLRTLEMPKLKALEDALTLGRFIKELNLPSLKSFSRNSVLIDGDTRELEKILIGNIEIWDNNLKLVKNNTNKLKYVEFTNTERLINNQSTPNSAIIVFDSNSNRNDKIVISMPKLNFVDDNFVLIKKQDFNQIEVKAPLIETDWESHIIK